MEVLQVTLPPKQPPRLLYVSDVGVRRTNASIGNMRFIGGYLGGKKGVGDEERAGVQCDENG